MAQRAPSHLSKPTAAWFSQVLAEYELAPHHVRLLTLAAEAFDRAVDAREAIDRLTFTPDGQRAAGNGTKKIVHVWDVASGQEIKSYPNQPGCNLAQVSFTPTGRELLYRSVNSGTSGLLEVDTGKFTPFNLGYVGMGPARWLPGGSPTASA